MSTDTLRYYERVGLLQPTARSAGGYRLYDDEVAERLRFIRRAQRLGLRLADIKEVLDVQDRGLCPCGHTRTLLDQRIAAVDSELLALAATRQRLLALKERNDRCRDASSSAWSRAVDIPEGGER